MDAQTLAAAIYAMLGGVSAVGVARLLIEVKLKAFRLAREAGHSHKDSFHFARHGAHYMQIEIDKANKWK